MAVLRVENTINYTWVDNILEKLKEGYTVYQIGLK
jgi:hypothetical protein